MFRNIFWNALGIGIVVWFGFYSDFDWYVGLPIGLLAAIVTCMVGGYIQGLILRR